MKKTFLFFFFLFFPFLAFSQTTLVKWYNADFSSTLVESHLTTSKIENFGGVSLSNNISEGADKPFYSSGNWPKPTYNGQSAVLDPLKYLQFTVRPEAGFQIKLNQFQFNARTGGLPSVFQVRYSKNADFSSYSVLQMEKELSTTFTSNTVNFPANTIVNSGTSLYIRIYVYNTENAFQLQHNQTGSIAPHLVGTVSLETPLKPLANDDRTGTLKNTSVIVDALGNDDYRFSGSLMNINATKPTHGTVIVNNLKDITYTPDPNYVGYDSFYYTLTNAIGVSNTAKVEVQVIEPGMGNIPLVRWNKADQTPKNYTTGITGSNLNVTGEKIQFTGYASAFELSGLPTPQQFDGQLDPAKYLSASVSAINQDSFVYLKSLKISYRGGGNGNITIKYSKTADFNGPVYTLLNNESYDGNTVNKDLVLPEGTFLFPNETLYLRIYTYNTWNTFFLNFTQDAETGPAITGISTLYVPEPCTTTVIWDGSKWSGIPTIDKKAIIAGDYNTALNGSFKACSLTVNAGKLSIAPKFSVTLMNEIKVNSQASLEVQNNGNLVQVNDAAPVNTGNITVLRDIKIGAARTQYNYLGSPVTFAAGQNLKTIYPGITYALYHNEGNNFFSSSSGANIPGRGLAVKEPTIAGVAAGIEIVTAKYLGIPQNGIINFPLANSNTGTNTNLGYNLLGNPYPSNIDLKLLYELNAGTNAEKNISATFYLWDNQVNNDIEKAQQGSSYKGQAYAVFNVLAGSNGTGTSAVGYSNGSYIGKKTPNQIIGTGQGFMTKALVKNYTLVFNNNIRTASDQAVNFFGKTQDVAQEEDRFWLKMISPANLTSNLAVVYFAEGRNTVGAEDTPASGASDELYSMMEDQKLAINGRASFNRSDVFSLGSHHFTTGNYTIAIDKTEGVFANGQNIYLKDKQTGIITNLSQGNYTFAANTGESTGRFEISYQPESVLATDAAIREEIVIYKDGDNIVLKSISKKMTSVEVYDLSGRLMVKLQPNNTQAFFGASSLNRGVYIIKINQGNAVTTKKILQ